MLSLDSTCSILIAKIISLIFLSKLISLESKKFFTTCWVIVEAPISLLLEPRLDKLAKVAPIIETISKPI